MGKEKESEQCFGSIKLKLHYAEHMTLLYFIAIAKALDFDTGKI
jgi:hypothetical protein